MHGLVGFQHSEAPASGETLTSGSEANRIVYPFDRHREGVDQWDCILGCVSVGHGNIYMKPIFIPCCHKISSGCQFLSHVAKFYPMLSQDFLRFAESGSFEL